MKEIFIQHLISQYPSLSLEKLNPLISPELLSPYRVELPASILSQAQEFISAIYSLRRQPSYIQFFDAEIKQRGLIDPGNKSICMSYDFHLDESGVLKLIEVNTNAAFLALGAEFYNSLGLAQPIKGFQLKELKNSIETEMQLFGKNKTNLNAAIIDEHPQKQRLYAEFLVYEALMKSWGWQVQVLDFREVRGVDFIYNRHTDFYLENPESQNLRNKFLNKEICFSPNPFEYLLMADKQRMIDWWSIPQVSSETIRRHLPESFSVNQDNLDEAWNKRKKLFFKPKRAFGSKQSYKGASMSRRIIEDLAAGDFIAQEFIAAPELEFKANDESIKLLGHSESQKFKYDLRFYTYQDQLQMAIARLYQGQTTNAKTLGGGFAPVIFI